MLRGYRSFLAGLAILAALFVAFGTGAYWAAVDVPQAERYQSYRYASDKTVEINPSLATETQSTSLLNRTPCEDPRGMHESELCAQWKAANAARDSAYWAKWGVFIAVVGSSLLLWQIALTRQAVKDTTDATAAMREANRIARRRNFADLRPHIVIEGIEIEELKIGADPAFAEDPDLNRVQTRLKVGIRNIGNGIALTVRPGISVCSAFAPRDDLGAWQFSNGVAALVSGEATELNLWHEVAYDLAFKHEPKVAGQNAGPFCLYISFLYRMPGETLPFRLFEKWLVGGEVLNGIIQPIIRQKQQFGIFPAVALKDTVIDSGEQQIPAVGGP